MRRSGEAQQQPLARRRSAAGTRDAPTHGRGPRGNAKMRGFSRRRGSCGGDVRCCGVGLSSVVLLFTRGLLVFLLKTCATAQVHVARLHTTVDTSHNNLPSSDRRDASQQNTTVDTRHDATHDTVCCGRDNPRSYEHVDRHPTTITMQQKAQCQSEIESSNKSIVDRSSHERPNVRREDPPDGRTTSMAQATLGPYANPLQPFCSLYSARSHS